MMETMIPPQVGMRPRTKKRGHKKREGPKNERKREKGQCYYPFYHTCGSKQHDDLHDKRVSYVLTFIYQWEFYIIELGLYIPMMGFLKVPQVFVSKQVGCTPTQFLFELSYTYSSSASVAWQSILPTLTSIDGHLHCPLISHVDVRLSPFLSSPHNPHHHILFHPQCYIHGSCSCIA